MRFLATDSIAENVARVLQRAQAGGHGASEREIRAIHHASVANLARAVAAFDRVRVYDATYAQAWAAAHAAVSWNQVGVPTDYAEEHYLVTDPAKFDQIGVWLESEGADKTHVSVVVIDDPNLPGPNEEGVQKDIASALKQIKAGQPTDKRP